VDAFIEQHPDEFQRPETRDVRLILNRDRDQVEAARRDLERDDSAASWRRVAARRSTDSSTSDRGGLVEGVVEGSNVP
jgi:hypothetical protein